MKNTLCIVLITFSILLIITSSPAYAQKEKLGGYLEYIDNFTNIKRVLFPSMNIITIPLPEKKNDEFMFLYGHDILPDGKTRVLAIKPFNAKKGCFDLFSNEKRMRRLFCDDLIRWPVFSPDGKYIAYLQRSETPLDTLYDWHLHLIGVNESIKRRLSSRLMPCDKPSWFPDGKRIAFSSADFSVYSVDVTTGKEEKLFNFGTMPTVSHDGKKVAYFSKNTEMKEKKKISDKMKTRKITDNFPYLSFVALYIYDIDKKQEIKITDEHAIDYPAVWSPDDKHIVYEVRVLGGTNVYVVNLETRKKVAIPEANGVVQFWKE